MSTFRNLNVYNKIFCESNKIFFNFNKEIVNNYFKLNFQASNITHKILFLYKYL